MAEQANWWEGNVHVNEQTGNKSVNDKTSSSQRKNSKNNKSTSKTKGNNESTRPRSLSRSRSFMCRTSRSGSDASNPPAETTERGRSQSRGRSPGKNRRRSLSLGRRRSRSQSRTRSDEYGHYAPTAATATKLDDDEENDGFGDDDDDVQVINELGLPANLPPNDDFLEEDYDPDKHGARDDFSLSCGTCYSDVAPVSLPSLLQDLLDESKEFCTSMCGTGSSDGYRETSRCSRPMSHVHCGRTDSTIATVESGDSAGQENNNNNGDDDSKTLATNDVPLKMEEGNPGTQMRRDRSGSRKTTRDESTAAPASTFSPYGDDNNQSLLGRGRSMNRTRSSPSKRSKSMERKLAKWKMARSKMKNKELQEQISDEPTVASPKSVVEAMVDETDWRVVRDDVLSKYESGHFVTYEAGRVRSSTKRCSSRATGQEGEEKMERFLYM